MQVLVTWYDKTWSSLKTHRGGYVSFPEGKCKGATLRVGPLAAAAVLLAAIAHPLDR